LTKATWRARLPDGLRCRRVATALIPGALGGLVFTWLTVPIPWMLGAMSVTSAIALLGVRFEVPRIFRTAATFVVGVLLGSAFTPDILARADAWAGAIVLNLTYLVFVVTAGTIFFRKVARYDRASAYFASAPGGLMTMPLLAEAYNGNIRDVSVAHVFRVVFVVVAIPLYLRLTEGALFVAAAAAPHARAVLSPVDAALMVGAGLLGIVIARLARLPAAVLMGSMIGSAAIHVSGLTASKPPAYVFNAAQLVLGCGIGTYFIGMRLRELGRVVAVSLSWTAILMVIAAGFAIVGSWVLDFPYYVLLVALSPGGQAEMGLVAIAMGIEAALVATLHFVRSMSAFLLAPVMFRLLRRWI
jgi:membrane AbrB-like protein